MILGIINGFIFGAMIGFAFALSIFWGAINLKMRRDIEQWERARNAYLKANPED